MFKQISRRSVLTLLLIITLALLTRTLFLNEAPIGLNHDEVTFVENAKAIALTGKDLSGTWSPLSLTPISYGFPMSELSFLVVSPLLGMLQSSPFAGRLPYALFSTGLVIVLYFIARKLFGEKEAIAVGLVAAFNPWGIMFGRTAFDAPLAAFFYMLAFLFLLYLKKWRILLTFIPLFIAFYSYIGTKIILIPFAVITSYFSWIINNKQHAKYYFLLCIACVVLTGFFLLSFKTTKTGDRISELITPFSSSVSVGVNKERSLSIDSPLSPIFSNKFVYFAKAFAGQYVGIFSPNYMFINGDSDMHLSLWFHGYFYYLDLIFLLVGFCVLFQKNKKYWLALTALILIAPLPSAMHVSGPAYITRSVIIFPLFILLIGLGITFFINLFKKRLHMLVICLLFLIYAVLFLNFTNIYLFRFPLYNSEGVDFSSRVLSRYVALAAKEKSVFIYTVEPDALYKDYLFYANVYDKQNTAEVAKHFLQHDFSLNNVHFKSGCPKDSDVSSSSAILVAVSANCNNGRISNTDFVDISQLGDGAPVNKIYFDTVCSKYNLSTFLPGNINLADFNIEQIPTQRFCEMFVTLLH